MKAFDVLSGDVPTAFQSVAGVARRRLTGAYDVDEWGLDPDLVSLAGTTVLSQLDRTALASFQLGMQP